MRALSLLLGIVALALVWGGPLLTRDTASFSAHMLAHLGVVALAAPLIALAVAGTAADPSARWPRLFSPVLAATVELVVVWGWHAPALRTLAENLPAMRMAEQASFLAAGLLLWLACFGHAASDEPRRAAAGCFALLLTSMHMTLLGALLALAPRPLYGDAPVSCLGMPLSAATDQTLGGVLMLLVGAAATLAGGLVLAGRLLREAPQPERTP